MAKARSQGPKVSFRTTILGAGRSATGIEVPEEIVTALGSRKRPPVCVTINGHSYRSTVAVMGGRFMVGVSAENRSKCGVAAGDPVKVLLELDNAPREVKVPADFSRALNLYAGARNYFDKLSYSKKRWFVESIESAKTPETRRRRIDKAVTTLRSDARAKGVA